MNIFTRLFNRYFKKKEVSKKKETYCQLKYKIIQDNDILTLEDYMTMGEDLTFQERKRKSDIEIQEELNRYKDLFNKYPKNNIDNFCMYRKTS